MVVVVVVLASGCILPASNDECKLNGHVASQDSADWAPGAVIPLAVAACSTCGHSHVSANWDKPTESNVTGYVELQLSPICPVQDTTVMANPATGEGLADNNHKNCGDMIDYNGYVTNRTNVTLHRVKASLVCPTMGEPQ